MNAGINGIIAEDVCSQFAALLANGKSQPVDHQASTFIDIVRRVVPY
jgi:hypothetical protein